MQIKQTIKTIRYSWNSYSKRTVEIRDNYFRMSSFLIKIMAYFLRDKLIYGYFNYILATN